jgi:hypothetical protein
LEEAVSFGVMDLETRFDQLGNDAAGARPLHASKRANPAGPPAERVTLCRNGLAALGIGIKSTPFCTILHRFPSEMTPEPKVIGSSPIGRTNKSTT